MAIVDADCRLYAHHPDRAAFVPHRNDGKAVFLHDDAAHFVAAVCAKMQAKIIKK